MPVKVHCVHYYCGGGTISKTIIGNHHNFLISDSIDDRLSYINNSSEFRFDNDIFCSD